MQLQRSPSPGDVQNKAIAFMCSLSSMSSCSVLRGNEVLEELGYALPPLPQTAQTLGGTKTSQSCDLQYADLDQCGSALIKVSQLPFAVCTCLRVPSTLLLPLAQLLATHDCSVSSPLLPQGSLFYSQRYRVRF